MKFETEYKKIKFRIELEKVEITDVALLLGDKFNRLPNQTMVELKKGQLVAYNLIILSKKNNEELTHYWSNILLPSDADDLLEEVGYYLEDEEILDSILANWNLEGDESGPAWK